MWSGHPATDYTLPMADVDLHNIELAAKERNFAHPTDTLRLLAEIERLKRLVPSRPNLLGDPMQLLKPLEDEPHVVTG
jgi:hypothetical protein